MKDIKDYPKLFDENGHLNEEGLAFYAEFIVKKDLPKVPESLADHVMDCSSCKFNCFELAEFIELQQQSENEQHTIKENKPPGIDSYEYSTKKRNALSTFYSSQLFKIAATVIILLGLGLIILNWVRFMKNDTVRFAGNTFIHGNTAKNSKPSELKEINTWIDKWSKLFPAIAASYQTNSKLEAMLKLVFRSDDFVVSIPDSIAEQSQNQALKFQWTDKKGKELKFTLYDFNGNLIHQRILTHHLEYEINKKLEPGLYYWYFEQSNFTVAAGRLGVLQN